MQDIIFENTAFNVHHWAQFSESEFKAECLTAGFFGNYSPGDRVAIIELVYKLIYDAARITTKE